MIQSKQDYAYYLACDRVALREKKARPGLLGSPVWKYQRLLRKTEYYFNCQKSNPWKYFLKWRLLRAGLRLGFSIPLNVFGPGLSLAHPGPVIVNRTASVGANCRVQTCVTIGATDGEANSPRIGNNVFLGDGCKVIGDITVADDVQIGANAVVVKSILEAGTTWGGIPARKISDHSSEKNLVLATELVARQK